MIPYFSVFVLLTIFHFIEFFKNKKNLKYIFFINATLVLILFAGLRKVGVGTDDYNYYEMFMYKAPDIYEWIFGNYTYDIKTLFMEPGFVFLNSFIKMFTNDITIFFMLIAFISVSIASFNYLKYSKYIFLTLLLFYVHTYLYRDINQLRAAIAAAIGLFLIKYIYEKKHLRVFMTFFIMSLFHIASLSLILTYILSFINITRKKVIIIYFISLLLGIMKVSTFLVGKIANNNNYIFIKLSNYIHTGKYINSVNLFDITNIKNSFILFLIIVFWDRLKKIVPYFNTIIIFYLLAVSIRIAFNDLGVIAARISTFFGIVEVILIPYFIEIFKQKIVISMLIIIYAFLILYLNLYVKEAQNLYEFSIF